MSWLKLDWLLFMVADFERGTASEHTEIALEGKGAEACESSVLLLLLVPKPEMLEAGVRGSLGLRTQGRDVLQSLPDGVGGKIPYG